jgi:hypothetical protein
VVVKAENNAGRLTSIDVGDGAQRDLIVSTEETVNRPFPSPDGRLLAFRRIAPAGEAIMLAPLTAQLPAARDSWVEMVAPETDARPAGWSPDGSLVYFLSARDGERCLYAQRVDRSKVSLAGAPFVVRHFHSATNLFQSTVAIPVLSTGPATAIGGGGFFYDLSRVSANIWLIEDR